jgi:hypothetical protein
VSGNARFQRGPVAVKVIRRPATETGLVAVTCAADPETSGYRCAYRGTTEQAIACLEAVTKRLWELRSAGTEPEVTP